MNRDLSAILNSIMLAEIYATLTHSRPYVYDLEKGQKKLFCYGISHIRNLEDPRLESFKSYFLRNIPDVLFVEGIHVKGNRGRFDKRLLRLSQEEVVSRYGESGFAARLALENGVPWVCPEPTKRDLYSNLVIEGFSKLDIFTWMILVQLPTFILINQKNSFKHYCRKSIKIFKQNTKWKDFDYSFEKAINYAQRTLKDSIDRSNLEMALGWVDPIPRKDSLSSQTILNNVAQSASKFRDRHIVTQVVAALNNNNKVMIVYGASHIVMQEPAYRILFTK